MPRILNFASAMRMIRLHLVLLSLSLTDLRPIGETTGHGISLITETEFSIFLSQTQLIEFIVV